jgi:hypothetical protein
MKMALGLFHFNPYWGLDPRMGRRHCAETLGPFLRLLRGRPEWCLDIEMSGAGLEFIQKTYPEQLRLLRLLVERGQVELISSQYTPGLWIAFMRRDLLRSVELNRRCLARLGFPWTRIFFAQEGFFGTGVSALSDHFDVAVCKDDYLAQQGEFNHERPCYTLGGMKVMIASNHLLNELAFSLKNDPDFGVQHGLSEAHVRHLLSVREISDRKNFPARCGRSEGLEWLWYHCGDGNHITAIFKPHHLDRCYYDSTWKSLCESQLESYERQGYQLATIGQLVAALDYSRAEELPPLLDGSWKPLGADGVFCWMGRNSTRWENDAIVLTAITSARARLVAAERLINKLDGGVAPAVMAERLEQGWNALLHAQISDSLGWTANAQAVSCSLEAADQAALIANQLIEEVPLQENTSEPFDQAELVEESHDVTGRAGIAAEIFGGQGQGSFTQINANVRLYESVFKPSDKRCGVRFPFAMDEIVFCPSGMEESPVRVALDRLKMKEPTLPLANGMLQIGRDLFLIKNTLFVHVAARIDRTRRTVEFAVERSKRKTLYRWRFFVVDGTLEYAVQVANAVNWA